jgi:hypothetical protein
LRPRVVFALYLGTIVYFAIIYSLLAAQFYHPYAKYENWFSKDAEQIATELITAFERTFSAVDGDHTMFPMMVPSIDNLLTTPTGITFELTLTEKVDRAKTSPTVVVKVPLWIRNPHAPEQDPNVGYHQAYFVGWGEDNPLDLENFTKSCEAMLVYRPSADDIAWLHGQTPAPRREENGPRHWRENARYKRGMAFFGPGGHITSSLTASAADEATQEWVYRLVTAAKVPRSVGERMDALDSAQRGFPRHLSGIFWRMLYFSAVTITTVGYGDIVPLTGTTRALVGFEATVGIVLLGIFVSSLIASPKQAVSSSR